MKIIAQVTFFMKLLILGLLVYICKTDTHKMYAKFAKRATTINDQHRIA